MGFQETFNTRVMPAAERAFGVSATLTRGDQTTESFTAIWETVTYEVADSEGFLTRFDGRDFMFPVALTKATSEVLLGGMGGPLIVTQGFGDGVIKPRVGDRIRFTENGVEAEFEVLPVGKMPAVELMPGGYRWKVHTKRMN